jgi:GNAT superfamily N-acetyltransferase
LKSAARQALAIHRIARRRVVASLRPFALSVCHMAKYPAHYESDVVLGDGSQIHLRPIRPKDATGLLDLYRRLSPRSLYHRFFTIPRPDPVYADYLADVDYLNHFALVAEVKGQIIAVARYYRIPECESRAEAAFTVADEWQARGIGSLMLERLAEIAREQKINSFEVQVLSDNHQMMKILSRSRFRTNQKLEAGVFNVILYLTPHRQTEVGNEARQKA